MRRDLALECLKDHVTDDIVVAVYQTCFDWMAINPRGLNYVSTGAMGHASSHGLGLALARPDKRVLVLDGDGSLLMNLGSLVSIGEAAPPNLYQRASGQAARCSKQSYRAVANRRRQSTVQNVWLPWPHEFR